jgi:succinoglycan biosynthesis transport protein ExoP
MPIAAAEAPAGFTVADAIGMVRRQFLIVLVLGLLGVALGVTYFVRATPKFTATATLLINTRKMEIFQQPAVAQDLPMQSVGAMESQVELLRSEEIARQVVKNLNLAENSQYLGNEHQGFVRPILHKIAPQYFSEPLPMTSEDRQNLALGLFEDSLA